MSAILMTVAALCEGRTSYEICSVSCKDERCGSDLLCHLSDEMVDTLAINEVVNLPEKFFPSRWLCPAYLLRRLLEKEKQALILAMAGHDPLAAYFPGPSTCLLGRAERLKESQNTYDKLPIKEGLKNVIQYLETEGYYCYNLVLRQNPKPIVLLYAYTHLDKGVTAFIYAIPDEGEPSISGVSVFDSEYSSWQALQHFYSGGEFSKLKER